MAQIRILAVGDVVGESGVSFLGGGRLRRLQSHLGADFTVVNGENSSKANCITPDSAKAIFEAGADVITGGNHTLKRYNIYSYLDDDPRCIRPANYPADVAGMGYTVADCGGWRILCINLLGTTFMDPLDSPFKTADKILDDMKGKYDIALVDIHAEATSEKLCMGRYLDGRVSAVFGTHTHIQTADARVLPGGTGYITDLGMTGPTEGVLGVKTENALHKFLVRTPVFFEHAAGDCSINGALFCIDTETKRCVSCEGISY